VNKILSLISPSIDFVKTNIEKIILVFVSILVFYFGFWMTLYSLRKLKSETVSYYPFDKIFPKSGHWSVIYFLITIALLGLLVYIITKGGFYLAPA
jgi:TRAP-type C4-dicarboxylate transport system permease small subunit